MSDGNANVEHTALELIRTGRDYLAQARDLKEVLDLRDKAKAVLVYTNQRTDARDAHAVAFEIMERSARKIGELCAAMPKDARGRKSKTGDAVASATFEAVSGPPLESDGAAQKTKGEQLRESGISRKAAARFERKALIPEDEHELRIAAGRARILNDQAPKAGTSGSSDYSSDEWSTPEKYIEAVRRALGGTIDLDPASNAYAANVVKATRWYHKGDSGLDVPWECGSLFLNWPYSRMLAHAFADKFCAEHDKGLFDQAIVLVNSSTETSWYQALVSRCALLCLPKERIAFELQGRAVEDNRNAQTFFYFGTKHEAFFREFKPLGEVLQPCRGFF